MQAHPYDLIAERFLGDDLRTPQRYIGVVRQGHLHVRNGYALTGEKVVAFPQRGLQALLRLCRWCRVDGTHQASLANTAAAG